MLVNSKDRVRELLRLAVSSHKSDGDSADSILSYNNPKNQADRDVIPCLLDVSVQIWTGRMAPLDCITYEELLRFLLKIDAVSLEAAQQNIEHINAGNINGKMALYCISEIRLAMHDLSSQAITSRDPDAIEHAIEWIKTIGDIYVEPILGMKTYDVQSFTTSLELLPVVVETLHALRRAQPLHSDEHQQHLFSKESHYDNEEEDYAEHEMLLDSVFASKWALPLLLPLSRIFCELYPYLSTAHLTSFQLKLTTENKKSEEVQSEDYSYAEVIRVALRLFEQSNDTRWVHVMRTLYRGVPAITYDSVQSLLEQIFTESVQVAKLLLGVLEDTAVLQGQNVTYQSIVLRQRVRNNMIDSIPIIDESDVRLALVVARSVCNAGANRHAQASGNMNNIEQIPLPVLLGQDSSPVSVEAVYEAQLCSRCVCMLVLACVSSNIRHFLNEKAPRGNKEQSASENDAKVFATVHDVLNRVINNTTSGTDRSSSGFHVAVRVAELVRALLVLGAHPIIAQDCANVVNGWFESAYQSNSAEDKIDGVVKVEKNSKPFLPVPRIQLPSVHDLLLHSICHVYKAVHKNIRPALLSCVLKGITMCANYSTDANGKQVVDTNISESANGVSSSVAPVVSSQRNHRSKHQVQDGAHNAIAISVKPLHELLQCTLYTLCTTATEYVSDAHSSIQPLYTALLSSRVTSCIARVQSSLIHCCYTSPGIFGMLQSSLQKIIQSTDPQRQFDSLRSMIRLLFAAPEEKQEQVVKTIQHAFARNAVYSREIVLLLMHYLNAMGSAIERDEDELEIDAQDIYHANNCDVGFSKGSGQLARHTLKRLQEMVKLKLDACFVPDQNDDSVILFDVTKCISGARSVNTASSAVPSAVSIVEDVGYLLQLNYQLDLLLSPETAISDLQSVLGGDVDVLRQVSCHSVFCIEAVLRAVKDGFLSSTSLAQGSGSSSAHKSNSVDSAHDKSTTIDAEAQLCMLLCTYSAVSSLIRCTLGSTSSLSCSESGLDDRIRYNNNQSSKSDSRASGSSSGRQQTSAFCCYSVLIDLCAVQDVILQLAASFAHAKINSHESLETYYRSKLTGAEVAGKIQTSDGASVGKEPIPAELCVPVPALQRWLQHLVYVCSTTPNLDANSASSISSFHSTLPTSTKYGIITYSASLVRVAITQTNNSTTPASESARILSTVLSLYSLMGATDKEDALITQEESQCKTCRKYLKSIYHTYNPVKRRKAIRFGRSTRRKRSSHPNRRSNADGDSLASGSDDGAIESQSENESEDLDIVAKNTGDVSPVEAAATVGSSFASPMGFQLTSVLSEQQLRQVQKNRDLHLSNMAKSRMEDTIHRNNNVGHQTSGQSRSAYSVHFIVDHCTVHTQKKATIEEYSDDNSEPVKSSIMQLPLMCGFLSHLDPQLQSEFSRWDLHLVRTSTNTISSSITPYCDRASLNMLSKEEAERLLSNYITPQAQLSALRDVLFDVRSELLLALTSTVQSIRGSDLADPSSLLEVDRLCLLMAKELKQSMQSGLTLRVFNAYLGLLKSLLTNQLHLHSPAPSPQSTANGDNGITSPSTLIDVSMILWGALGEWRKEHKDIVPNIVHLALQFSALSGHAVDLDQCSVVLQSIAHQKFTPNIEDRGDEAENSGSDSENEVISTCPCGKTLPILSAQDADEAETPAAATAVTTSSSSTSIILKEDTAECKIVVTEETSDQVVKEVLQYLHQSFSNVLKQQQVLSASQFDSTVVTSESSVGEALQSSVVLFSSGGKVLNAMYGLFDDADVKNIPTKSSITDAAKDNKKKSKNTKDSSVEPPTWLVDTLSGPRTSNVLELLTKVTTQAVRECNVLLKAAQHFRRVCNFIVSTQRQAKDGHVKRKERNTFSDSEEEEEEEEDNSDEDGNHQKQRGYDSESSGVTASSTTSTAVLTDPVQVQIAKLSSVSTVVHCVTLSALLSAVPAKLVANHVAWLEAQPAIKRTQKACAQLDDLKRKLFAVLQQLEKIPPELCEPRDSLRKTMSPRLWTLLNQVHNPQLEFMLTLVNTKGQDFLECLQEPTGEEDDQGDSGESETERDIRTFGRRTVHQGRAKVHLRGAPHSSKISALTATKAARLAAAVEQQKYANKGGKKERRKSRNQVINMFMDIDGDCGGDSFADLEDFLVPDQH